MTTPETPHSFRTPLARDLFAMGASFAVEAMPAPTTPSTAAESYRLAKLVTQGREAEFAAMDRRDRSGPHYPFRS